MTEGNVSDYDIDGYSPHFDKFCTYSEKRTCPYYGIFSEEFMCEDCKFSIKYIGNYIKNRAKR